MKILNLECNKSDLNSSSISSFVASSDDSSSHNNSAYSEPVTMRWRSDSVAQTDAKSPETKVHSSSKKNVEELFTPSVVSFKTPLEKIAAILTPPSNHKEQYVAPAKLSLQAMLSPTKPSCYNGFLGAGAKLPLLPALSFPLLSQEETAEVQPLSPMSSNNSNSNSAKNAF